MIGVLPNTLTAEQSEIIKTVLYFDIFRYPLTEDELFEYSNTTVTREIFGAELNTLVENGLIVRNGEFIMSLNRNSEDIQARLKGNSGAGKIMPTAHKYSKKIASFPFVEAVCISGSLSKNYFDARSDIDFFIITRPGRLWLCRTFLILRYKLLPARLKKYWCTNYFISADDLTLPDRNAFTATELAFLKPTINHSGYKKLLEQNHWYKALFPNKSPEEAQPFMTHSPGTIKRSVEWLLSGRIGQLADNYLLRITHAHWRKKFPEMSEADFNLQYRSKKNVCKRHTKGFQNKVLKLWQEQQEQFEKRFNATLQ
jgi:hypothetical protein